jgi:hypothetical protein
VSVERMSIGRRYELLLACAAHTIPEARRNELLDRLKRWMDQECGDVNHEELFYVLGAMAGIQMINYCEQLQKESGLAVKH